MEKGEEEEEDGDDEREEEENVEEENEAFILRSISAVHCAQVKGEALCNVQGGRVHFLLTFTSPSLSSSSRALFKLLRESSMT